MGFLAAAAFLLHAGQAPAAESRKSAAASHVFAFGNRQYHLVAAPAQRIVATLSDDYQVQHLQARQWLIYAPDAPATDDQTAMFSTLTIDDHKSHSAAWSDFGPSSQSVLSARLSENPKGASFDDGVAPNLGACRAGLNSNVTYTALLYRRELVPGPPLRAPEQLSDAAWRAYTQPSETIDYDNPLFQSWLNSGRLRRLSGERDLDFALRVFRLIRSTYFYKYDVAQDRRASAICCSVYADCGGLSQLFVAALRANSIPAVALCGRFARSAGDASEIPGNVHVKSQFYATGVGWVPVEMSGAVYDRTAPERVYFGRTAGDFLTLSIGNDQQLNLGDGISVTQRGLQGIRLWVWGVASGQEEPGAQQAVTSRSTSCWSVRQLPISTLGRQVADARQ